MTCTYCKANWVVAKIHDTIAVSPSGAAEDRFPNGGGLGCLIPLAPPNVSFNPQATKALMGVSFTG